MCSVFNRLIAESDGVVLLGADSPQLSAGRISQTVGLLAEQEFVLGPAADGGFYLLAGKIPIPLSAWERVSYSAADTATKMTDELSALGRVGSLETLVDVDVRDDLERIVPSLRSFAAGSPQQHLADWIGMQRNSSL